MKHIKMPKEIADKWLAALRGGEFEQGWGRLYNPVDNTYCCLGVLEKICLDKVEDDVLPSLDWLDAGKIVFLDKYGWVTTNPYLAVGYTAARLNDDGASFQEIADYIEEVLEVTEEKE